jgi:hypothetical protein
MLKKLKKFDFELAYLTLLTKTGLKPLSRWEKKFTVKEEKIIRSLGLKIAPVQRLLLDGTSTSELLISCSDSYIDLYTKKYSDSLILKTPESIRFEGFLFGFPPCCVENYLRHGYQANHFAKTDQELLFHWACPHCQITPLLIPEYKRCRDMLLSSNGKQTTTYRMWRKNTAVAASLAFLAATTFPANLSTAKPMEDDPHRLALPIELDQDQDYLEDRLEKILGLQPNLQDTDGNGIVDGVQTAQNLVNIYNTLPHELGANGPYVVDYLMYGLEKCTVCGEEVNMGYAQIINPLENQMMEIPYLSLHHFLAHGSLAYDGDVHGSGRINGALMNIVVNGNGTSHKIPMENDAENDGLADREEPFFGTDASLPDSDGDSQPDGVQWSRTLAAQIDSLPRDASAGLYAVDHMMRGFEYCHNCGEAINMGYVEIINSIRQLSMELPYISLHFMRCNGFSYEGDLHTGRVDIKQLHAMMETRGDVHQLPVPDDSDQDVLKNFEETTFSSSATLWDSNNNSIGDGTEAALLCLNLINALPETPQSDQAYKEHHMFRGIETCEVCGATENMGFIRVIHPVLKDSLDVPYIARHYLEHGSFGFYGDIHLGRLDPVQFLNLIGYDPTAIPDETTVPEAFDLVQNYPNPFNSETTIGFRIAGPADAVTSVKIFDAMGCQICTLIQTRLSPGDHTVKWGGHTATGKEANSGVYFVKLQMGAQVKYRKMVLVR